MLATNIFKRHLGPIDTFKPKSSAFAISLPMSISIRPATPQDVSLILAFIKELATYEREPDAVLATEHDILRALFPSTSRPAAEAVIGSIDNQPLGFAVYFHNFSTWLGKPGLYLEDLYVRPAARGKGLGKALFAHVAKVAIDRNCLRLEWNVLDWNTPAKDFYLSLGAVAMEGWTIHRMTEPALSRLASSAPTLTH
jgi:GNAT superfamily N-acetyltransferase